MILFLLVLIMLFSLTSCQKTHESIIVTGKNNDLMLKIASGNEKEKRTIFEMLNIPERMTLKTTNSTGNICVNADADIILPDTNSIPIVKVRGRNFTQEEADRIIEYFIGDAAFNNRFETGYTYEEEKLMYWMEELSKETDPVKRKFLQRDNDKFKSAGITIPDKPHDILPAPKVFEPTEYGAMQIKGYSKYGKNHKYLIISNHLAENKNMVLYTCEQKGYADIGHEGTYNSAASKSDLKKLGLETADQVPLSISPEDARNKAFDALRAMNISNMGLFSCEEVWGEAALSGSIAKRQEHHAYRLEFVRNIGGALMTYTENNINRTFVETDERTGKKLEPSWPYERIMFIIDDTGIVEFLWESPYEITEQVVENAKLMPFDDIKAIFSKMIFVTHAHYGENTKLTFNIDRIQLGMMRIQDKYSPGTGLIVPVWDFFGTMSLNGQEINTAHTSHLTVNAVDGSIINRMKGY